MSTVRLCMAMSLDGFIAGPNDVASNGLGDNGERLHDWLGSSGRDRRRDRKRDRPRIVPPGHRAEQNGIRRDAHHRRGHHRPPNRRDGELLERRPPQRRTDLRPDAPHRTTRAGQRHASSPTASRPASSRQRPLPVTATSCCTAPTPRRNACVPASWTRSSSKSYRSCSARAGGSSTVSAPSTSSSNSSAPSRRPTYCTCAIGWSRHDRPDQARHVDVARRIHHRPGRRPGTRARA